MLIRALRRTLARLAATWKSSKHDEEFRAELEEHLRLMVEARVARGMSQEDAQHEARLAFGGATQMEEQHRDWRSLPWLSDIRRDVVFAFRSLRRDRLFLFASMGILALGVGASTAAFSVVKHTLFRPLPYAFEERIVSLGMTLPWVEQEFLFGHAYAQFRDELATSYAQPIERITSLTGVQDCEIGDATPKRLACAQVESTFLSVLGVRPLLGSDFTAHNDEPGAPPVVLVSHALWTSRFGGDRSIIGRSVLIDKTPSTIIGVLSADFELPTGERAELLMPQRIDYAQQRAANPGRLFRVFARLQPDTPTALAAGMLRHLVEAQPGPANIRKDAGFRVRSVRDLRFRDIKLASWLLLGSTGCIFLITCSNVGFLLVARAAARRREKAIRAALGASKGAIVRQTLSEALLITIPGGAVGYTLGFTLLRLFANLAPAVPPQMDTQAIALAILLVTVASIVFCLTPLVAEPVHTSLNAFKTAGGSVRSRRFRQGLVIVQIAVCIALLSGAATMLRSLWQLRIEASAPQGRIAVASFILSRERFPNTEAQAAFFDQLQVRLRNLNGVDSVAISDSVPPSGITRSQPLVALDPQTKQSALVIWRFVTSRYFDTLGIPIVQGRSFREDDEKGAPVVVINEALARRLFPGDDAARHTLPVSGANAQIIGVVASSPQPEYYALRQRSAGPVYRNQMPPHGWRRASVLVRSSLPAETVKRMLQAEIASAAPAMDITTETMRDRYESIAVRPRFQAIVLGSFGLTGLLLAVVGLYGLIAYLSQERAREFSVRAALGASAAHIQRIVLSLALRWVAMGGLAGVIFAFMASRILQSISYEIVNIDPYAYLAGVVALGAACVLSAWGPARRAARIDPAITLRSE